MNLTHTLSIGMTLTVGAFLLGCAGASTATIPLHQSPKGTVSLEQIAEPSIQAAHPISISPVILARVLGGVRVKDERSTLQVILESAPAAGRAFTEEEIEFLAPLLSEALAKATADQQVRFRIVHPVVGSAITERVGAAVGSSDRHPMSGTVEETEGTVFAYGLSLHLTITQYRHRPEPPDTINMANRHLPDSTGLEHQTLSFAPETVLRPSTFQRSVLFGDSEDVAFVIDYAALSRLPESTPTSSKPSAVRESPADGATAAPAKPGVAASREDRPAGQEDIKTVKELIIKKDLEVEALKEELRTLRQQLSEQQAERQKTKPKPKKKPSR